MSDKIHAYAAINKGDKLKPSGYYPSALGADQVEKLHESHSKPEAAE